MKIDRYRSLPMRIAVQTGIRDSSSGPSILSLARQIPRQNAYLLLLVLAGLIGVSFAGARPSKAEAAAKKESKRQVAQPDSPSDDRVQAMKSAGGSNPTGGSDRGGSDRGGSDKGGSDRGDRKQRAKEASAAADALLHRVLRQLAYGPAFHAKIRKRVRGSGKEVIGVGSYEQAGHGTGQYHLQVTMHDGVGKHTLQQVSDGRLAWTRLQIADSITLKRVNLGALTEASSEPDPTKPAWRRFEHQRLSAPDDGKQKSSHTGSGKNSVPVEFCVGGLMELLSSSRRDYELTISGGTLENAPVWILAGMMTDAARSRIMSHTGGSEWPALCPRSIRIAIARQNDETTGFGMGLPLRIEFRDEPSNDAEMDASRSLGRLIGLLELYSIQAIAQPPAARFRFSNDDAAIQFVDDTERYLSQ